MRRWEIGDGRQEARGRRQEARGKRQLCSPHFPTSPLPHTPHPTPHTLFQVRRL
ncbi:MAG: hypothetical protein PX634_13470 [Microcystis sp. M53600_WE12]|nr:hypothetical protein [Microcystis sp. M53600_WE12]